MKKTIIEYGTLQDTVIVDADGNESTEKARKVLGAVMFNATETTEESLTLWGDKFCQAAIMFKVEHEIRRICKTAKSPEEAQDLINRWTPGVSRRQGQVKDEKEVFALLANMAPEEARGLLLKAGYTQEAAAKIVELLAESKKQ